MCTVQAEVGVKVIPCGIQQLVEKVEPTQMLRLVHHLSKHAMGFPGGRGGGEGGGFNGVIK